MDLIYIPTSSLNFNNILSTESISPRSFYSKRNFGYKRFANVEPNPYQNSIIAYNKLPIFSTDDSDFDNYPLVIELPQNFVADKIITEKKLEDGLLVYQLNQTIYLHPNKVRFLFFQEKHKNICLIKTEPSIETKLLPIYKPTIQVLDIDKVKTSFNWITKTLSDINDLTNDNIPYFVSNDSKLDKIKGFYYSYFIGILLSKFEITSRLSEDFIQIKDKIINLLNKNRNLKLKNDLIVSIKKLSNNFDITRDNQVIPTKDLIDAFFFDNIAPTEKPNLIEFLKNTKPGNYDFYDQLKWYINKLERNEQSRITLLLKDLIVSIEQDIIHKVIIKKINRIDRFLTSIEENVNFNSIFNFNNISFDQYLIKEFTDDFFERKGAVIFQNIVNGILGFPINDTQSFKEKKVDLSYKIGSILKDYVNNWESSAERRYINSLMDNIENYKPFDIKSHPKEILQSISIFIQKGDDPEKMIRTLNQNNIADYRTSLGLLGAIFGFSNLPKTITNVLFYHKSNSLTIPFYIDVQKKLHNVETNNLITIEFVDEAQKEKSLDINTNSPVSGKNNKSTKNQSLLSCPICNADMVLRNSGTNKFYGCSNFTKTGCKGTRDYTINKIVSTSESNICAIITEYVTKNGHSKISDIIPHLKSKTQERYKVSDVKEIINNCSNNNLVIDKISGSNSVRIDVVQDWTKNKK